MKPTRSQLQVQQRLQRRLAWFDHRWWWILTGLLLGFSFPPFPIPYLAWFALVPLLVRWSRATEWHRIIGETYFAFFLMHLVAMHWVAYHTMGTVAFLSSVALLVLPIPPALAVGLSFGIRHRLGLTMGLVSFILLFLGYEYLMGRGAAAFLWLQLGNSHAEALLWNQIAEWTGVAGLSFWLLLLNVALFMALIMRRLWPRIAWMAGFSAVAALPLWLSADRLAQLPVAEAQIQVAVVQPAMYPEQWAQVENRARMDTLLMMSNEVMRQAPIKPSLVVWPETALPLREAVSEQAAVFRTVRAWAADHNAFLLTGAISPRNWAYDVNRPLETRQQQGPAPYSYYNSALLVHPGGTLQPAHKRKLVPFAEFVPFSDKIGSLTGLGVSAGGVSGYNIGPPPRSFEVHRMSGHQLGTLICFESVFGDRVREEVQSGASLLVTMAQNGWWQHPFGRKQHLAFSRLRSIETRRAIVWATVSGPSGLILPDGSLLHATPYQQRIAPRFAAPLHDRQTFFTRHGDWLGAIATVAAALLLLLAIGFGYVQRQMK